VSAEVRETAPSEYLRLTLLQLLAAWAPLLLYALFVLLESVRSLAALLTASQVVFPVLALLAGLMGGYQFPLASRIYFAGSEELRVPQGGTEIHATRSQGNPGILYGLDLLGACLGAVALSAYLVPVYGFRRTAMLMAVVNLGPAALTALAAFEGRSRRR
jgi:predicted membrane-bound spermidine synthase